MEQPTHFCESCGSPLAAGNSFCEACGAPVKSAPEIPQARPAQGPPPPLASPPPAPARMPVPPPQAAAYQPVQPPPPPAAVYYQAPPPPPPGYYAAPPPPPQPQRKSKTWLIVGGVILALVVCCGLAALVGGFGFLTQLSTGGQNQPPAVVTEETAVPLTQDTDVPIILDEPTRTSEPAPNEPQATPELPAPQGQMVEYTDDLSTNDNGWVTSGGDTAPRQGYLPSVYFIETTKEIGEVRAFIPRINNNQYKVRDFEVEFDGLQFDGDGYLGLDFHYVDNLNFYQVAVKDGSFLIRKKINGQFTNLTHGPWVRSNSINETGPNHIKVICHGSVIRLEANNDLMAQIKDKSLDEGFVVLTSGVLPEAPDGTTAQARFANFHVVWWK